VETVGREICHAGNGACGQPSFHFRKRLSHFQADLVAATAAIVLGRIAGSTASHQAKDWDLAKHGTQASLAAVQRWNGKRGWLRIMSSAVTGTRKARGIRLVSLIFFLLECGNTFFAEKLRCSTGHLPTSPT